MLKKIHSFIDSLTAAKSVNEDEARREHMIKVFMLVIFIVVTSATLLLLLFFSEAIMDMAIPLSIFLLVLGIIVFINYKGGWKFSLFVPTGAFLFLSVWGIFNFGYALMNLMEFTILIFVTALFLNKAWQWIVVLISVFSIGLYNWTIYPGDMFNLAWEVIIHFGFLG